MQTIHKENKKWTAHEYVKRLGMKLKDENSILYWAAKRGVNIFITDLSSGTMGSIGIHSTNPKRHGETNRGQRYIVESAEEQLSTSAKKADSFWEGMFQKHSLEALVHGGWIMLFS